MKTEGVCLNKRNRVTAWEVHALLRAQNVAFRSGNSVTYTGENIWEETSEREKKKKKSVTPGRWCCTFTDNKDTW